MLGISLEEKIVNRRMFINMFDKRYADLQQLLVEADSLTHEQKELIDIVYLTRLSNLNSFNPSKTSDKEYILAFFNNYDCNFIENLIEVGSEDKKKVTIRNAQLYNKAKDILLENQQNSRIGWCGLSVLVDYIENTYDIKNPKKEEDHE